MRLLLPLIFVFLQSCTIYTSSGRRDFESRSPDYIRTQAFVGCEPVTQEAYDQGFLDSFWSRSFHRTENAWVAHEEALPNFIQVLSLKEDSLCSYQFANEKDWIEIKEYFLSHLE